MARVNKEFLSYLDSSVAYIYLYGSIYWIINHYADEYFQKTLLTLLRHIDRVNNPEYNLPPNTRGWSLDDLCYWFVLHNVDFTTQMIPSIYKNIYEKAAEITRPDGTIKKRSPFHINDANTYQQQLVREIFLKARDCFKHQMDYHAITNPDTGYKSRGYWFNQAISSGLYYYTYFMQETLSIMFGPEVHDKYPFAGQQTPEWCKECTKAEKWSYTPVGVDDFIFSIKDISMIPTMYIFEFTIKAAGDPEWGSPGNPDVLRVKFGVVSLDEDAQETGSWYYHELNPIGSEWQTVSFAFVAGPDSAKIYAGLIFNDGDGDYTLLMRNMKIKNAAGGLELQVYGTQGDSFQFDIGQGIFSFIEFANV